MSIYETKPSFSMGENEEEILSKITILLKEKCDISLTQIKRLSIGQNINYKVYVNNEETPSYLLRIISKAGYPDLKTLEICNDLLTKEKIYCPNIVFFHHASDVVPYGFFLQTWISGIDGAEKYPNDTEEFDWIKDFTALLNRVHQIKMPYIGYLNGPQYKTIQEYYQHLDIIIDHSFGNVFTTNHSIWDLEKKQVVSSGFLSETFSHINELIKELRKEIKPVLNHGDMFAQNLIYSEEGVALIDWDETRAHSYVYEVARTCLYIDSKELVYEFLNGYHDHYLSLDEVDIIIRLEHVRQLLRVMMINCFNREKEDVIEPVLELENMIQHELHNRFLD